MFTHARELCTKEAGIPEGAYTRRRVVLHAYRQIDGQIELIAEFNQAEFGRGRSIRVDGAQGELSCGEDEACLARCGIGFGRTSE